MNNSRGVLFDPWKVPPEKVGPLIMALYVEDKYQGVTLQWVTLPSHGNMPTQRMVSIEKEPADLDTPAWNNLVRFLVSGEW